MPLGLGPRVLCNTGPGLATPGGASLRQSCCGLRDVVGIVANARFSVRDQPICGSVVGYLLSTILFVPDLDKPH